MEAPNRVALSQNVSRETFSAPPAGMRSGGAQPATGLALPENVSRETFRSARHTRPPPSSALPRRKMFHVKHSAPSPAPSPILSPP